MGRNCVEVNVETTVEVDLDDIDTEELMEALRDRGCEVAGFDRQIEPKLLEQLYDAMVLGCRPKVDELVRDIIYQGIGKML